MEKQLTCFPHVAVKIFDFLDIRSLARSREVCKLWKRFIESSKFSWMKFIKRVLKGLKLSEEIQRQWKRLLYMANIKQLIGIAGILQATVSGITFNRTLVLQDFSPLLILAQMKDSINLFKDLSKKIPNDQINPTINYKYRLSFSCLHFAVLSKQVELFGFIIEKTINKNPNGLLHLAASSGNLEICKIILAEVGDLSCLDEKCSGQTPLDFARESNHLDICFYFNEVRNQSTLDIGWIFNKNIELYFPEETESKAVITSTTNEIIPSWFYFTLVLFLLQIAVIFYNGLGRFLDPGELEVTNLFSSLSVLFYLPSTPEEGLK